MAKALKRQPDWVLQKLGLERGSIQSPKSNRVEEEKKKGEVTRLTTPRYSPPHMRNLEQPFKVYDNPLSDVLDNNYEKRDKWKNTPYHENKNQYNYRQYNNYNGERRTNSGEITSNWNNRDRSNNVGNNGGNHGNNGNYGNNGNWDNRNGNNNNGGGNNRNNGNNGGNRNYQINNYGCRPPMTIERYKQLDFSGIVGYPNQIANDLRTSIPKFTGNGIDSVEQHQAFKTTNTIENNRKVTGRICKRDDPKLYNPRTTKKDEFGQIMDMLKDMKGKQNHNEKLPPYRSNKPISHNRPRLHGMPYNTKWKDGKPVNANLSKETLDPLKKVNNFVEEYPWCEVCNLPHVAEQCMIAQGFA
ncbi:uncharacterized protein LOC131860203 [Cryptomeria japonica]|uniref:uncharacterized protein LOC131860203 n=1 Tax=Cryptomeria japonica TaxID=3369 RepID=UPI0027DA7AAB|nr:uncharacterized protein LOC131860203 [Cryptomeria japonica]